MPMSPMKQDEAPLLEPVSSLKPPKNSVPAARRGLLASPALNQVRVTVTEGGAGAMASILVWGGAPVGTGRGAPRAAPAPGGPGVGWGVVTAAEASPVVECSSAPASV